ncbi:probable splicing factor, arginine/serine-rich 7 [Symsagittifera roscoffensis]|uniref:probable splicing factor, arginine/serine-rich 7 n=1 Tax=Symsagittifera roscoffensis TaxID=84072 RepID=UPI00307B57BB
MGKIVRVSNVSHSTSLYQLEKFFNYIGQIEDIKIYPSEKSPIPVDAKICFVKYKNSDEAYVASLLNGSTLIDKMLVVSLFPEDRIPSEERGLEMAGAHTIQPIPVPGTVQMVNPPFDPDLAQLGLSQPPPLPASLDPVTVEKIRRTVYVRNLNPATSGEVLVEYFSQVGSVNYVAIAMADSQDSFDEQCAAYIEFSDKASVIPALKMSGTEYNSRKITVNHSGTQVDAPLFPTNEVARSELKLAAKQYKDAEFIIRVFIEPDKASVPRSRSPSPLMRNKSLSLKKERADSRGRSSKSRLRSKSPGRSSKKRSSSRKKSSRHSSRYRSRSKKRRSRSRDREKSSKRSSKDDKRSKRSRSRKASSKRERKKSTSKTNRKKEEDRVGSKSERKEKERREKEESSRHGHGKSSKEEKSEKKRKRSGSRKRSSSRSKKSKRSRSRERKEKDKGKDSANGHIKEELNKAEQDSQQKLNESNIDENSKTDTRSHDSKHESKQNDGHNHVNGNGIQEDTSSEKAQIKVEEVAN